MGVRTECKNCDFSDILEDEEVGLVFQIDGHDVLAVVRVRGRPFEGYLGQIELVFALLW